ncbi:MAG: hypothetical protein AVO39_09640 [delta proteobacterium MLS_D]|jgi:hypothetical protein|nr:MAG: hypothetical protein AVO39_09640 [delta proteobacterium MLS_D]
MGRYLTADNVKQAHIEKLGDNLGSLFNELENEVASLCMKWEEYVELFGKTPSRIGLLNQSAPVFFKIVQDSLWEDILLHLARLTDSPKSAGKDNLTLRFLPNLVDVKIRGTITNQITDAEEKTNFCRDWRNRHIAHRDLKLVIDKHAEPLKPASRAKVKDALDSFTKILNTISEYYMKSTIAFDSIIGSGGAEELLYVLDDGIKVDVERRKRIEAGKYLPEDLVDRNL